jgi:hypothetical protein
MDIFKKIKGIFDPNDDQPKNKIQKRPVKPPKKDAQPTLGHAPAQRTELTKEYLNELVKAASDPAVQDVINNQLVQVFHPELERLDKKKSGSLRNK